MSSEWDQASWFAKWTFSVANPMLDKGVQKTLVFDDMMKIPDDDYSRKLVQKLEYHYQTSHNFWFIPRLMIALLKTTYDSWLIITFYTVIEGVIRIALPLVLIYLLKALQDDHSNMAYLWAGILSILGILQTCVHHILFYYSMKVGWNWKNATTALIYNGLYKLNKGVLQNTMSGRMVNLISNDVSRFEEFTVFACFTWESFFEVVLVLLILIYILDVPSAVAGVGSTILFIPLMIHLAKMFAKYRGKTAASTDRRVRNISEIIDGIATVKSYAWETPFFHLINSFRMREINMIKISQILKSINQGVVFCTPPIISFITFVIFWGMGGELTVPIVFSTISLVQVLRMTIGRQWTRGIETGSEAIASCIRIESFLSTTDYNLYLDETAQKAWLSHTTNELKPKKYEVVSTQEMTSIAPPSSSHSPSPSDSSELISIQDASFYYGDNSSNVTLSNISFSLSRGELIAIVGTVGSGKTSLLLGALGELNSTVSKQFIQPSTSIAYCSQKPWIVAASVKGNIVIPTSENYKNPVDLDDELYKLSLESCLLVDDLMQWPGYDETEVGERGVSISGGQKARISLARAVYSDSDIYLLDDPLSAVDAHVGKALMFGCLINSLKKRNKGVMLVTHQLQYLKYSDKILVLSKNGEQTFFGSFDELQQHPEILLSLDLEKEEVDENSDEELETPEHFMKCTPYNKHFRQQQQAQQQANKEEETKDTQDKSSKNSSTKNLLDETSQESSQDIETNTPQESEEDKKRRQIISVEDSQTGKISLQIYWNYITYGGMTQGIFILSFFFCSQALLMITDYWVRWWASNKFYDQNKSINVVIFAILVVLCIVFGFIRAFMWFRFTLKAATTMHQKCLWSVIHSPLRFFVSNPTGRILNRFAKDQNQADETLPLTFFTFLDCLCFTLAGIILVCVTIPWLILLMPVLGFFFYYFRNRYICSTREIKRIEAVTRSPIYADFSSALEGLITLRAYKLETKISTIFQQQIDKNGQAWFSFLMASRYLGFRLDLETSVILIFVSFLGVILRHSIDIGLIGFALVYTMNLSGLLQWTVRQSAEVEAQMTSIERIQAYADLPPEEGYKVQLSDILYDSHSHSTHNKSHHSETTSSASKSTQQLGHLQLHNLTVRYRNDLDPVLSDVNLDFPAGSKVALVGRTGSGKSSSLLAILRLNIISSGDIILDGKSLLDMDLETARSHISVIPQEPHLFSGTIRFNLDPFSVYSDHEIWSALEDAHIKEYISQNALGLSYEVDEGGKNFSVGQRQLLSLARAILRKCKVVLMDEVTASIDFQTDRLIQETIRTSHVLKEATIITVAHRLRTIADSDLVVVVNTGKIVEQGEPKDLLMNTDSFYYKLAYESGEFEEILRIANLKASISTSDSFVGNMTDLLLHEIVDPSTQHISINVEIDNNTSSEPN